MPGKRVRMLFIGNSFTTKNDLPTLLSVIAQAGKGITIESKVIALLDESLAISSELGMRPLMERVLSRREILSA